jgi:hypothetical protein
VADLELWLVAAQLAKRDVLVVAERLRAFDPKSPAANRILGEAAYARDATRASALPMLELGRSPTDDAEFLLRIARAAEAAKDTSRSRFAARRATSI